MWRLTRVAALALLCSGCGSERAPSQAQHQIVGWVNNIPIHASVVAQIASQRGLSEAQALEHASDTIRLYLAYRETHKNEQHNQALLQFLTLQGAVQTWLVSTFEPSTLPSKIPGDEVQAILEKLATKNRPFGPRLHGLCQIIVQPKDLKPKDDARLIASFEPRARALIADLNEQLQRALPELKDSKRCELFDKLTNLIASERPADIQFKREALRLDLSLDHWDQDFVDKVAGSSSPELLPPFMTKFGLHLVYVSKVFPAHLEAQEDGQISPAVAAKRETEVRSDMLERWRSNTLKALLQELRKSVLIEWAQTPE